MDKKFSKYRLIEGVPRHDGDCYIYACDICTCGLLHALAVEERPDSIFPGYYEQWGKQHDARDSIQQYRSAQVPPSEMSRLEEWNNGHKARSVYISIDDGYGATCWTVELHHEHGVTTACEVSFFGIEGKTYAECLGEAEKQGHTFAAKVDPDESDDDKRPGLVATIGAALDAFSRGIWNKKGSSLTPA